MASNLLDVARQESKPIDEEKLRFISSKCDVWDHFKISKEQFNSLPDSDQTAMLKKFYRELEPVYFGQTASTSVDSGISDSIRNASKVTMTNVIENDNGKAQMSITVERDQEKRSITNLWKNYGYFGPQVCDISIEKVNLPENTIFYINQGYFCGVKDNKKIYYCDVFILEQMTPLLDQPKTIDDYVPKENEVKILRSNYNTSTEDYLGLEYCVAYLTVRNDLE